jgi:hypothetical protein
VYQPSTLPNLYRIPAVTRTYRRAILHGIRVMGENMLFRLVDSVRSIEEVKPIEGHGRILSGAASSRQAVQPGR